MDSVEVLENVVVNVVWKIVVEDLEFSAVKFRTIVGRIR